MPTVASDVSSADFPRANDGTCGPFIPVETLRPKLTRDPTGIGMGTQRDMSLPDTAPPPGRGKEVLVEFPQDELIAKWEEFFEEFGHLSKIISIADRYPEDRSLSVAFDELNRFDTDMAIYLLRHPLNVLMAGVEAVRTPAPPGDGVAEVPLRVQPPHAHR